MQTERLTRLARLRYSAQDVRILGPRELGTTRHGGKSRVARKRAKAARGWRGSLIGRGALSPSLSSTVNRRLLVARPNVLAPLLLYLGPPYLHHPPVPRALYPKRPALIHQPHCPLYTDCHWRTGGPTAATAQYIRPCAHALSTQPAALQPGVQASGHARRVRGRLLVRSPCRLGRHLLLNRTSRHLH